MAKGTVTLYAKFKERVGDQQINLSTAILKLALTNDATAPGGGATASDPRWGAGGAQNLSTNEVAAGGGYTTGGKTIDGADPWTINGADCEYTAQNPVWLSNFSGDPTDIKYGVVYVDDGTNYYAVGYVQIWDGATAVSLLAGDVIVKWDGGVSEGVVFSF